MAAQKSFVTNANPWLPMTDTTDVQTLGKFIEELSECASAASRCLIQGIDEMEPSTGKVNRKWLQEEIADVIANHELTCERFNLDLAAIRERADFKKEYLRRWHSLEGLCISQFSTIYYPWQRPIAAINERGFP